MKKIYIALMALLVVSCSDYLDKGPLTSVLDDQYWTSETSIRTFSWGFLSGNTTTNTFGNYFFGYGQDYTYGRYFEVKEGPSRTQTVNGIKDVAVEPGELSASDDYAGGGNVFTSSVPNTGGWDYSWVRKSNLFIDRINKSTGIDDATRKHWLGVARFYRGLAYALIVKGYGDCPYFDRVVDESERDVLFKARDPRAYVVGKMIEDFDYAIANTRVSETNNGYPAKTTVTRDVVAALASRVMLYEGGVFRYYPAVYGYDKSKAVSYYQKAKEYAQVVMNSGSYSINNAVVAGGGEALRSNFVNSTLSANSEVLMYRSYASGIVQHSVESYVAMQNSQVGVSKNLMDAFLSKDGLPQKQSSSIDLNPSSSNFSFRKLKTGAALLDPRIKSTICPDSLRLQPAAFSGANGDINYASTGMAIRKFLNDNDYTTAALNVNTTCAPIVRYAEVLLNYAEACAEIANTSVSGNVAVQISQADLDKSINKLRDRIDVAMPHLQTVGGFPAVGGVLINDPDRDVNPDGYSYEVPPMIWEIRRERRIELALEGFRYDDLKRWGKLHYLDYTRVPQLTVNRGAWIDMSSGLNPKTGETSAKVFKLKCQLAANNLDNTVASPWLSSTGIPGGGGGPASGYILYTTDATTVTGRVFKTSGFGTTITEHGLEVYLTPIGKDQFTLYKDNGYANNLKQNPGWENK